MKLDIKHLFVSVDGHCNAFIENQEYQELEMAEELSIVRHKECSLFIYNEDESSKTSNQEDSDMCKHCKKFKSNQLNKEND